MSYFLRLAADISMVIGLPGVGQGPSIGKMKVSLDHNQASALRYAKQTLKTALHCFFANHHG